MEFMKYLYQTTAKFLMVAACTVLCESSAEALHSFTGKSQIGIDGANKIVAVWESSGMQQANASIQGAYGPSTPDEAINITDPKLFSARRPLLATSSSVRATTKAAAVWMAKDLTTNHKVIQATTLNALGWNNQPATLSYNDGTEEPFNDYQINISADGKTIVVSWTAYFPSLMDTIACAAISKDGGLTWSKPEGIAKLSD